MRHCRCLHSTVLVLSLQLVALQCHVSHTDAGGTRTKRKPRASKANIARWQNAAITSALTEWHRATAAHKAHALGDAERQYLALLHFPGVPPQVFGQAAGNAGSILLGRGDSAAAAAVLALGVAVSPTAAGHYNLAVALHDQAQHATALPHAKRAAVLRAGYTEAEHLVGLLEQELGRLDAAQAHFQAAAQHAAAAAAQPTTEARYGTLSAADVSRAVAAAAVTPAVGVGDTFSVREVSAAPPIWAVDGLLSPHECRELIALATDAGMTSSWVTTGNHSATAARNSSTSWLKPEQHPAVRALAETVATRVLGAEWAQLAAAIEPLQVVSYGAGQHFAVHHDSQRFHRRSATLLIYLSDLSDYADGATWFPFANLSAEAAASTPATVADAISSAETAGAQPGMRRGLRFRGAPGSAILFLNQAPGPGSAADSTEDPSVVHAGEPVSRGEKWIANFWIRG
jgi:tetratricopeptide (TPR) repeat protein